MNMNEYGNEYRQDWFAGDEWKGYDVQSVIEHEGGYEEVPDEWLYEAEEEE